MPSPFALLSLLLSPPPLSMLWLAAHLPLLPLEAFSAVLLPGPDAVAAAAAAADDQPRRPVALVAEHRITHADAAAAARGVRPGMKRATALALAADLVLGEADAARDAAALQALAHAALAFTPSVALHDEATVVLEVEASLRLFGGLAALAARLRVAFAPLNPPLGHHVWLAAAPTALGAALLARWPVHAWPVTAGSTTFSIPNPETSANPPESGPTQQAVAAGRPQAGGAASGLRARGGSHAVPATLDPVLGPHARSRSRLAALLDAAPAALLGPAREQGEALDGMGLATLAHLRVLPRDGLARRFGEALLADLDRAYGRAPDPRAWLELPERFESRLELNHRADTAEQVLAAAAVLLARLVAWAEGRHARIAAFTLAMHHEPRHRSGNVPATELRIELAEPALDAAHLQLLLRERLARIELAAPTLELRLRCRELVAGAPPNRELFPSRQGRALGLARLLERLRARLGDERVQRIVPVADHRPEHASRAVPALAREAAPPLLPPVSSAGSMPARSGARTAPPAPPAAPAAMTAAPAAAPLPLGRSAWPTWLMPEPLPLAERDAVPMLQGEPLVLVSGPERIEAGWWQGQPAARDYFIAMAPDGSLVWVWRDRLPPAPGRPAAESQWFLQGRFG